MALTLSVLSLEYVKIPVAAIKLGSPVDPTGDVIAMAFPVSGVEPVAGDWKTGSWEISTYNGVTTYLARCLVGPGGAIALAIGTYDIWIKITDNPEIPVIHAGQLVIQ